MTTEPRQWTSWENLPENVTVSDVDGDQWRKTRDGFRFRYRGKGDWRTQKSLRLLRPDDLDAPYAEVLS